MRGPACPICGSHRFDPRRTDLLRCRGCGTQVPAHEHGPTDTAALYNREYFEGRVYRDYVREKSQRIEWFRRRLSVVERHLPRQGRVLDVGCAAGFFLELMRARGYSVHGLDVSAHAVCLARNLGLEVRRADIRSARYPSSHFDLVTMWDVLEHVPDPLGYLREAHRILRPTGVLLVETLNIGSFTARLLGRRWPLFAPPYHLFYFTRPAMRMMLARTGFLTVRAVPVQSYVPLPGGITTWRYADRPLVRALVGSLCADVLIYVAVRGSG